MPRELIAPTKSNLIHIKERLQVAEEGYDLLEQKREILVMELMRRVEQVKLLEKEMFASAADAYPALKRMLIVAGRERSDRLSRNVRYRFDIRERRVREAGINLPGIEAKLPDVELQYSAADSFAECDETASCFFALLKVITELAAVRTIAWRLAHEVRKTQRRVNALEKLVIPAAKETRTFIEAALEEKERDSFFSCKLLKRKKEAQAKK